VEPEIYHELGRRAMLQKLAIWQNFEFEKSNPKSAHFDGLQTDTRLENFRRLSLARPIRSIPGEACRVVLEYNLAILFLITRRN
jgi:hypothetical protein